MGHSPSWTTSQAVPLAETIIDGAGGRSRVCPQLKNDLQAVLVVPLFADDFEAVVLDKKPRHVVIGADSGANNLHVRVGTRDGEQRRSMETGESNRSIVAGNDYEPCHPRPVRRSVSNLLTSPAPENGALITRVGLAMARLAAPSCPKRP